MPSERIYRIHPGIGFARVGNARKSFFIGPEKPGVPANPNMQPKGASRKMPGISRDAKFKDKSGRIKRQAARFRVFEYQLNVDGSYESIGELTADKAELRWTVKLANNKPAAPKSLRSHVNRLPRNGKYVVKEVKETVSGRYARAKSLRGKSSGSPLAGGDGKVYLGTLLTDAKGRLVVLGGRGRADGTKALRDFYSNRSWCDDVSDGPVTVEIRLHGHPDPVPPEDVRPAWVIVGPPDFAPPITQLVTLYDRLFDVAATRWPAKDPLDDDFYLYDKHGIDAWNKLRRVSFEEHIEPLFKRALASEWVFKRGWKRHPKLASLRENTTLDDPKIEEIEANLRQTVMDAVKNILKKSSGNSEPDVVLEQEFTTLMDSIAKQNPAELADVGAFKTNFTWRNYVFQTVCRVGNVPEKVPLNPPDPGDPQRIRAFQYTMPALLGDAAALPTVTSVQYEMLSKWCVGLFLDTTHQTFTGNVDPQTVTITPEGLDRAALEACSGGPFYPGIEASVAILEPNLLLEPFRIDHTATIKGHKVGAGFFTQQMALPWQADFFDCAAEGSKAWWPAQRPITVFSRRRDARSALASDAKGSHSGFRVSWDRQLEDYQGDYRGFPGKRPRSMIRLWSKLGFIVDRDGVFVERERNVP